MKIIACGSVPPLSLRTNISPAACCRHRSSRRKRRPGSGPLVSFEPGARTFWHTHPLGQTLYVISGAGRAQTWGGPIQEIKAGDVISFDPGEKHWHGAGAKRR